MTTILHGSSKLTGLFLVLLILLSGCRSREDPGPRDLQDLSRSIAETASIEVLWEEDSRWSQPWDYSLAPETDETLLQERMEQLTLQLGNYPAGMLKALSRDCGGLRIQLVESIHGKGENSGLSAARGLQWRDPAGFCCIAIAKDQEYTLYHELCHVIEDFLLPRSDLWDDWEKRNPSDFQYDLDFKKNQSRDGRPWLQKDTRAFIDTYSMSFPREDRARIMEYAMTEGNESLFSSPIMQEKLELLSCGIREVFGLTDSSRTFLWEQYRKP